MQNKKFSTDFFLLLLESWGQWRKIYPKNSKMKRLLKKIKGLYEEDKTEYYDFLKTRKQNIKKQQKEEIFKNSKTIKEIREKPKYEINSFERNHSGTGPVFSLENQKTNSEIEISDDPSKSIEMERLTNFDEFQRHCKSWGLKVYEIQKKMKHLTGLDHEMPELLKGDVGEIMVLGMDINRTYQDIFEKNYGKLDGNFHAMSHQCGILRRVSTNVYLGFEEFYENKKPYDQLKELILAIDTKKFTKFDLNFKSGGGKTSDLEGENLRPSNKEGSKGEKEFGTWDSYGDEANRKMAHLDTIKEESMEFDSKRQSKISFKQKQEAQVEYQTGSLNNMSNNEKKLGFDDFQSYNENTSMVGSYASGINQDSKSHPFNFSSEPDIKKYSFLTIL